MDPGKDREAGDYNDPDWGLGYFSLAGNVGYGGRESFQKRGVFLEVLGGSVGFQRPAIEEANKNEPLAQMGL